MQWLQELVGVQYEESEREFIDDANMTNCIFF